MTQRIVLVSGPIHGPLWSLARRKDIQAIRDALACLKKHPDYRGAILTAPYLLHAEVSDEGLASRVDGSAGYGLVPHTEIVLVGESSCPGMQAEIARARQRGMRPRRPLDEAPTSVAAE